MGGETKSELIKFALKIPQDGLLAAHTIPFLHALNEDFKGKCEIHILGNPKLISFLSLLPFPCHFHPVEDAELTNPLTVHRYCANLQSLFNVHTFFSFEQNLLMDAFVGVCLRAERRVGFVGGMRKPLLTHRVTPNPDLHHVEEYLSLLSSYTNNQYDELDKLRAKELTSYVTNPVEDPYVVINLTLDEEQESIDGFWLEFFEYFETGRAFFICEQLEHLPEIGKRERILKNFLDQIPKKEKRTILPFAPKRDAEVGRLMAFAKGVISENSLWGQMSAYCGAKTLLLFSDDQDPSRDAPLYFSGISQLIRKRDLMKENKVDTGILYDHFHDLLLTIVQLPSDSPEKASP